MREEYVVYYILLLALSLKRGTIRAHKSQIASQTRRRIRQVTYHWISAVYKFKNPVVIASLETTNSPT